jgi:nucleoside-diphosphate-sugar epimerase
MSAAADPRILVTGGTSSIGKVLVRQLSARGGRVRLLMRPTASRAGLELPGVELVPGDVTDSASVDRATEGCSLVYHLAAIVGTARDRAAWDRVNVQGSRNVFEAARRSGARVVFVSSIGALGWTEPGEIADETRPRGPRTWAGHYGRTKNEAEDVLRELVGRGLRGCTVYPGFGYGPSRAVSHPGLTDNTLLRLAAGKPLPLLWGRNRLCVSYFQDTVRGCIAAAERGRPGEGYVLGGDNLTFQEIIAGAAAALGRRSPRLKVPVALLGTIIGFAKRVRPELAIPDELLDMFGRSWAYSSAKAERELGFRPTSYEQGMRETWRDWQALGWRESSSSARA